MTFKVYMLAFCDNQIREVDVPDPELPAKGSPEEDHVTLDLIFHYGQNDFQPKPFPSVSVGDVIDLRGTLWVVKPFGFQVMTPQQFESYKDIPRKDRALFHYLP